MAKKVSAQLGGVRSQRAFIVLPFGTSTAGSKKSAGSKGSAKTRAVNASRTVFMKLDVAKALGFKESKTIPMKKVTMKTAAGNVTYTRHDLNGGFRQQSVTILFNEPKKIGDQSFKSVALPLPKGVTVSDVMKHFAGKAGAKLGILGVRTPSGKTYDLPDAAPRKKRTKAKTT
jgi:hypothetical protein